MWKLILGLILVICAPAATVYGVVVYGMPTHMLIRAGIVNAGGISFGLGLIRSYRISKLKGLTVTPPSV